jgi:tRNA(Ile)-lysidine synthase
MELLDRVRRTIRRHDLARSDTGVVVGLSGGSDSVALAHILRALEAGGELRVAGVAHFNHQLRTAADGDERFCAGLAASMGWRFVVDREDIAERATRAKRSIESVARTARHEFFERAREYLAADVVALGHTRDDQAETFLLRLLRGAGVRGLSAMHPRHGPIVRPLLDVRRADLRSYLESRQIAYVHDTSNDDVSIPRNRVRGELLPFLERFNPSVVEVLADEADLARAEWQWMEAAADEQAPGLWRREGDTWRAEAVRLAGLPPALARLVVRRALVEASGGRSIAFSHVEDVRELGRSGGGPISVPGCRVQRLGGDVVLTNSPAGPGVRRPQAAPANLFSYPLSIPGEAGVAEIDAVVSAEVAASATAGEARMSAQDGPTALVRLDRCGVRLAVRNRRPGDRFRPVGLDGRKKLQDFFVDRKVPRQQRDLVPLVVDEFDRIVWVAGHTIDEEFRVTDSAQAVLILRLKPLGGPA